MYIEFEDAKQGTAFGRRLPITFICGEDVRCVGGGDEKHRRKLPITSI